MAELMRMAGVPVIYQFVLAILLGIGVFGMMYVVFASGRTLTEREYTIVILIVREWLGLLAFFSQSSAGSKQKTAAAQQPPRAP